MPWLYSSHANRGVRTSYPPSGSPSKRGKSSAKTMNTYRGGRHPYWRLVLVGDLIGNHLLRLVDHDLRGPGDVLLHGLGRAAHAGDGGQVTAWVLAAGDRNPDVLWRAGHALGVQTGDVDALGLVLVGGRDDLDDVIARELKLRDVHGGAVHQVSVEDAEDGLVGDDEQIVLLALEF